MKNAHLILERKQSSDYAVIGVAKTREEANQIMDYFQKQIERTSPKSQKAAPADGLEL